MFRSCTAAVLTATLGIAAVTGLAQAQNPTNGDDLIFRSIAGDSYVIHRYTTVNIASTFSPPDGVTEVEYLIVAGGGAGGWRGGDYNGGGGGGAGGLLTNVGAPLTLTGGSPYPVAVGAGGSPVSEDNGENGAPSSVFGFQALGGGGGARFNNDGNDGGSGGGAAGRRYATSGNDGGEGEPGQGHKGGNRTALGTGDSSDYGGAGGGGAGSAGADNIASQDGQPGGAGVLNTITGENIYYAGGGGGGRASGGQPGTGGSGGGGAGHSAGTDGHGGGGGGGSFHGSPSPGKGGSGVVVVRYGLADVTSWKDHGYYALPDQGIARTVLVDDVIDVQVCAGHEFSILPAGTLTVGNGGSLAVQGTLNMQGTLNIDPGGDAAIDAGGRLVLDSTGSALAGELLIGGGAVVFNRNNQIADTASVIMTAGSLNWTDQRNNHTETFTNLTATGGTFRPGTGSNWTITGAGEFTGGTGSDINIAANSGSQLTFGSLTLTDLTSTTAATNNSFTIYGNNPALTTVSVGPGGLTLNNSRILMQWTSGAGNALILGGDVTATGTSTIQDTGSFAGSLRLNTTGNPVTRTFDIAGNTSHLRITANVTDGAAGAAGILKAGAGLLTLQGTNDYTGGTTVAEGIVSFRSQAALPAGGQVSVAAGAALALGVKADDAAFFSAADVDALFTNTFANVSMADGSLVGIDTAAGNFTYASNTPAVNRGLVKVGPGTLWLTGNNQHEGDTIATVGTLNLNTASGRAVPGNLIINGGTVTFSRNNQIGDAANVIMSAGRVTQRNNHQETLGGLTITGGEFRTGEDSRWTISGDATFTGEGGDTLIVVNSGTRLTLGSLTLTNLTSTDVASDNSFTFYGNRPDETTVLLGGDLTLNNSRILMRTTTAGSAGAALALGGNFAATGTSAIQKAGDLLGYLWLNTTTSPVARTFNVAGGGSLEIEAVVTDGKTGDSSPAAAGSIVKTGLGTLAFLETNTYTGQTVVSEGTLRLNSPGAAVPGNLFLSGGNVTFSRDNQISDTANVTITAGHLNTTDGLDGERRSDHTETFASLTATGGSFVTGFDSSWTITDDGSFTGGSGDTQVRINSGAHVAFGSLTLTDMTSPTFATDKSFTIYGSRLTTVTVGDGGLTLDNSRIILHRSSGQPGNALILGGDVAANGTSAIQKHDAAAAGNRFVWLNTTADAVTRTFDVAGGGALDIEAVVTDGQTGGGSPAAAGSIVKTGLGTLRLAAANTYTGTTTVFAGTLEVTGSLAKNTSADVLVASAGTTFDGTEPTIVRRVANNVSLAGLGSQIVGEPRLAGFHTEAQLLAGENETGGPLEVGMAWRMFGEGEAQSTASYLRPVSDVLQLSGMADAEEPTDPFVLQMTYDESLVTPATEGGLHLAWHDATQWVNAVTGNIGTGTDAVARYWGPWDSFASEYGNDLDALLGSWGVDTDGAAVWAVLNHNSQFGVLVPEPGSFMLLAFAVLGLLLGRQRRFRF